MADPKRARNRKRGNKPRINLHITAPVLDPTGSVVDRVFKWVHHFEKKVFLAS
jgi:hypothetical protein